MLRRFLLLLTLALAVPSLAAAWPIWIPREPEPREGLFEETLTVATFGELSIYRPAEDPAPPNLVLFLSGDGGWSLGVVDMARTLAQHDAIVAGIDVVKYLKRLRAREGDCYDAAGDFERTAAELVARYRLPPETKATLLGYSSGATLLYGVLVQGSAGSFAGGVSLGFCPDIALAKPLCGVGAEPDREVPTEIDLLPGDTHEPWVALQGSIDQVCQPEAQLEYLARVPHGEIVMLPKVGHGFSISRRWEPQMVAAFERVALGDAYGGPSMAEISGAYVAGTSGTGAIVVLHLGTSADDSYGEVDRGGGGLNPLP
jgi:hypothetical protein